MVQHVLRPTFIAGAIAVAGALVATRTASAQPLPQAPIAPVVVTAGEHVVRVAPDVAWIDVVTESRAKLPRDAQRTNATAMAAVQEKLRASGIGQDALRTRGLDLRPEYDYNNGRQTLREYVAVNTLEVRVDAIDRVGELIDLAVNAGGSRVDNLRFDVKRRAELEREALKRAVEAARSRAEAMAAGAGRTLGSVLRISDQPSAEEPGPRPMMRMAMAAPAPAPAPTPVAVGELEVRAQVMVVFALGEK